MIYKIIPLLSILFTFTTFSNYNHKKIVCHLNELFKQVSNLSQNTKNKNNLLFLLQLHLDLTEIVEKPESPWRDKARNRLIEIEEKRIIQKWRKQIIERTETSF